MPTTPDQPVRSLDVHPRFFTPGIQRIPTVFVNAYLIAEPGGVAVLVDTGLPGFGKPIRRRVEEWLGGRPPAAIVLTHAHFDHAGTVVGLAEAWGVPVYVHRLEMPYVTGRSNYPPHDPTVGGALGLMSRMFPHRGVDLGGRARVLPEDGSVPGLPGWRWLHTPGHTAGHVSLFRENDRTLLAGDALATLDQDSGMAMVTQRRELSVPPAPFTTDWGAARESVRRLAALAPVTIAAGHGLPVHGPDVAADLARFAEIFQPPRSGRYVRQPALADESGVLSVPPPVFDPLRKIAGIGAVAAAGYLLGKIVRRRG